MTTDADTRLLVVVDAAVADAEELPPDARDLIHAARDVLRSSEHANWQERRLVQHVKERFGLRLTAYVVDPRGHVKSKGATDAAACRQTTDHLLRRI